MFVQGTDSTDHVVFPSRVLYLALCDINVLHANLFAVVSRWCAGEGQQHQVDGTNINPTSTGADSRPVMVSDLVTVEVRGGEVNEIELSG